MLKYNTFFHRQKWEKKPMPCCPGQMEAIIINKRYVEKLPIQIKRKKIIYSLQYSFSVLCVCCFNDNMPWGGSILVTSI
jgi:hypothetical protein